jgi:ribose transport system substrate-binding protein
MTSLSKIFHFPGGPSAPLRPRSHFTEGSPRAFLLVSKTSVVLQLLFVCLGLVSCGSQKPSTIVFIAPKLADDMWQAAHTAAEDAARGSESSIYWNGPIRSAEFSRQIQLIDRAIKSRSQGIIIVPDQSSALISPIHKAISRGLPVVVVGSPLRLPANSLLSYVLNDEAEAGRIAARRIGKQLHGTGSIAVLGDNPDTPGVSLRMRSFEATLQLEFPRISIVAVRAGPDDDSWVEQVAQEVLDSEPRLRAIFALNGTATLGALRALRQARKDNLVLLVGCDQQYEQLYYLSLGKIDSIVAEDTYRLGYRATRMILDRRSEQQAPQFVLVKPVLITRDTMYAPEVANMLSWDWRSMP